MLVDAGPDWTQTYQTWLDQARPFLVTGNFKEAFVGYPWVQPPDVPFTSLAVPLHQVRLGVVSTAGFYVPEAQAPFAAEDGEGDTTYRRLPDGVTPPDLAIAHTHYPHAAARQDWNAVLPLDHLRAMVAAGELGSLGPIISISGYCTNAARLISDSAQPIAAVMREAGCDAVLLVPV